MNKFKKLYEKRAQAVADMELLTTTAETEERAMTEEEQTKFSELEAEIRAIDATIEAGEKARKLDIPEKKDETRGTDNTEESEIRAFADFIRGEITGEQRAEMSRGANGAVIPTSIANKIIEKVKEISPLYQMAEKFNVKGTLTIPYYDETQSAITMAYANEFTELTSTSGKFTSITLQAFLAGALTKVSKSLVNNSDFDIVNYVVNHMAQAVAEFLEKELLVGTANKVEGLSGATQVRTAQSATAITADELIDVQEMIPDRYQGNACWIMNKQTRTAIRKLKDGQGNYLLEKDATSRWGYKLFGKDVYISDQCPAMATGAKTIYYGDFSGLAVKLSEDLEIEVLRERFSTEHAVGVVGWVELDAKIQDQQKIAVLQMA